MFDRNIGTIKHVQTNSYYRIELLMFERNIGTIKHVQTNS